MNKPNPEIFTAEVIYNGSILTLISDSHRSYDKDEQEVEMKETKSSTYCDRQSHTDKRETLDVRLSDRRTTVCQLIAWVVLEEREESHLSKSSFIHSYRHKLGYEPWFNDPSLPVTCCVCEFAEAG